MCSRLAGKGQEERGFWVAGTMGDSSISVRPDGRSSRATEAQELGGEEASRSVHIGVKGFREETIQVSNPGSGHRCEQLMWDDVKGTPKRDD